MHLQAILADQAWDTLVSRVTGLGSAIEHGAFAVLLALVVLLVAWALATIAAWLTRVIVRVARLDRALSRVFGASPAGHEPSTFASWLAYWAVLALGAMLALDTLGLDLSGSVGARLDEVVPRIVSAGAIFAAGLLVAMLIGGLTRRLFDTAGMRGARVRALIVSAVIIGFSALIALDQLGFAAQFVMAIGVIAAATVGLAAGLAFGLGCRDLARDFVIEYLRSQDAEGPRHPAA
jgi:hypothetical protein